MKPRSGVPRPRQRPRGNGATTCIACGERLCIEWGEARCHNDGCAKYAAHRPPQDEQQRRVCERMNAEAAGPLAGPIATIPEGAPPCPPF